MVRGVLALFPSDKREKLERICRILYEMQTFKFNRKGIKRMIKVLTRTPHENWKNDMRLSEDVKRHSGMDFALEQYLKRHSGMGPKMQFCESPAKKTVRRYFDRLEDIREDLVRIPMAADSKVRDVIMQLNIHRPGDHLTYVGTGEVEPDKKHVIETVRWRSNQSVTLSYEIGKVTASDRILDVLSFINKMDHGKYELRWFYVGSKKEYDPRKGHVLYVAMLSKEEWQELYDEYGSMRVWKGFHSLPANLMEMERSIKDQRSVKGLDHMKKKVETITSIYKGYI